MELCSEQSVRYWFKCECINHIPSLGGSTPPTNIFNSKYSDRLMKIFVFFLISMCHSEAKWNSKTPLDQISGYVHFIKKSLMFRLFINCDHNSKSTGDIEHNTSCLNDASGLRQGIYSGETRPLNLNTVV